MANKHTVDFTFTISRRLLSPPLSFCLLYLNKQQQKLLGTTSSDKAIQHDAKENVKGLGQYLHAQEQLEHWRNQYAETQAKAQ